MKLAKEKAHGGYYVSYLLENQPPKPEWKASGPPATWPQQWATDTLRLVRPAYRGLKISDLHTVPAGEKHLAHTEWKVTLSPGYRSSLRQ